MSFLIRLLFASNIALVAVVARMYLNGSSSLGSIITQGLDGVVSQDILIKDVVRPNDLTYEQRTDKIKVCRHFLREYEDPPGSNPELGPEFPPYIPVFKEKPNAIGYDYNATNFKNSIAQDWAD